MGEPQPGDIVDNIFWSVDQLPLRADQDITKGDILVPNGANWEKADSQESLVNGFAQARVDANTAGEAHGDTEIECAIPPSEIYAVAGGALNPQRMVELDASGQKWTAATSTDISNGRVGGRYMRKAGSNVARPAADDDVIIIKTGVAV